MSGHERMFRHEHAHELDDPERQQWLPPADVISRLDLAPGLHVADVGAVWHEVDDLPAALAEIARTARRSS